MKNFKLLNEFRREGISYSDESGKVTADLSGTTSQIYTKLVQKLQRIEELAEEMAIIKDEVKQATREDVAELFDLADAINTRVILTKSFLIKLTKDPKETVAPKYKEILLELEKHMAPELLSMSKTLKETMVTCTQKAPALSYERIKEGIGDKFSSKIHNMVEFTKNKLFGKLAEYDKNFRKVLNMARSL